MPGHPRGTRGVARATKNITGVVFEQLQVTNDPVIPIPINIISNHVEIVWFGGSRIGLPGHLGGSRGVARATKNTTGVMFEPFQIVPERPGGLQTTGFLDPTLPGGLQTIIFVDPAPPGDLPTIIFVDPKPPGGVETTSCLDPAQPKSRHANFLFLHRLPEGSQTPLLPWVALRPTASSGLLAKAVPDTGFSCEKSPKNITFNPPTGR